MMRETGTLLLTRGDIVRLLTIDDCIDAVEQAFRMHGTGTVSSPGILGVQAHDGGFHIKAGLLENGKHYFAAKMNANFPQNMQRAGLPTIQGVIVLCDGQNGQPLSIMDSIEITIQRTGAATAIAGKYLARADAAIVTLCGCGNQGKIQLRSLMRVRRLQQVFAYDVDDKKTAILAAELFHDLGVTPISKSALAESVRKSDIVVTCTPSREHFLSRRDVAGGTFIAAVGADSEDKQEIDPALFPSAKIVVDILEQCATIGDLHHALAKGLITRSDVHAELGEIVAGRKPGRTTNEEITIFDSTGMALQDVATAILVYEKAIAAGVGSRLEFN